MGEESTIASDIITDDLLIGTGAASAIGTAAMIGFQIYLSGQKIKNSNKATVLEAERIKLKKGGSFTMPYFPWFYVESKDLDERKDMVSFLFFINKSIGNSVIREYYERTSKAYDGREIPLKGLKGEKDLFKMKYAFSSFSNTGSDPVFVPYFGHENTVKWRQKLSWSYPTIRLETKNNSLYY